MLKTEGRSPMGSAEEASALAVEAITFLANDPRELSRFLQLSGLKPDEVRRAAADPAFFAGLLDYILGSEKTLSTFCAQAGIDPSHVVEARTALSAAFAASPR